MRKLIKSKRGIAEEISDTAFALLVLFLGIAAMTTISSLNKAEREDVSASLMNQAIFENSIGVYLKQPVSVDDQSMAIADLLVLAADTNSARYKNLWKEKTDAFFSSIADQANAYAVDIDITVEGSHFMDAGFGSYVERKPGYYSIISLPSHSGKLIQMDIAWTETIQSYKIKPRGGP
jgi:hypothetical protein